MEAHRATFDGYTISFQEGRPTGSHIPLSNNNNNRFMQLTDLIKIEDWVMLFILFMMLSLYTVFYGKYAPIDIHPDLMKINQSIWFVEENNKNSDTENNKNEKNDKTDEKNDKTDEKNDKTDEKSDKTDEKNDKTDEKSDKKVSNINNSNNQLITNQRRKFADYQTVSGVTDPLFWIIFLSIHGYIEYRRHDYNFGKFEIDEKQRICTHVKNIGIKEMSRRIETPLKISDYQDMLAELSATPLTLLSLWGVSDYYKRNVYLVIDNIPVTICFQSSCKDDKNENVIIRVDIRKIKRPQYYLDSLPLPENNLQIVNYRKPIPSKSQMLKPQLIKMCEMFNIDTNQTKNVLYDLVLLKLNYILSHFIS